MKNLEQRLVRLENQTAPPQSERKTLDDFYNNPPDMSAFYPPIPDRCEDKQHEEP